MKKILVLILVLSLAAGLLAGCGGEENTVEQLGMVSGETVTLSAGKLSGDITWTSSDPEKLTVDANGAATALAGRGTVTVTATAGEKTKQFAVTLGEETEFGTVSLPSVDDEVVISVWNGSYHDISEENIKLLADAGISLMIGLQAEHTPENGIDNILDYAQKYGVSVMTDLRNWDTLNIPEYVNHPALAGFLMFDEPNAMQLYELVELKEAYDEVMPEDKLFFVNLLPTAYEAVGAFPDACKLTIETYEDTYTGQFVSLLDVPYISADIYSLMEDGRIRPSYFANIESVAQTAKDSGRDFWLTVLTAPHGVVDGRYMTPGEKELRWQMAVGMTYGSKDLTHYVLCSHDTEDYDTMFEFGTFETTEIYDSVSVANNEILAWDDIFAGFAWQGVTPVDVGETNNMLAMLSHSVELSGAVTKVESDQDLLVGVFDNDGQSGYMVTNAGDVTQISIVSNFMDFTMEDASVTLTLEGEYRCAAVISKGEVSYVPVTNGTVSLTVEAYEGVFVIPVA